MGVADHLLYYWRVEQQQIETHACRDYRLQREFITPSTPEQNGIIDRFFLSLKNERVEQHTFQTVEALRVIQAWMYWYN